MGRWRWRAFGLGLLLAAALGVLAGALEAFGSHPMDIGRPDLGDLAYAVDLHLLAGLAIALALRLLFWRTTERTFPTIVLGGMLMLELGVVGAHWVTKAPFLPPFYTTAGKAVGALAAVIGLALGAWIARSLSRAVRGEAWMRWVRGLAGALGIILAVGIGVANGYLAWRAWPRPERIQPRADRAQFERPDVFVILVDALRRDHVSWFGYPRTTSPSIDRLLSESIVFTAAYTPSTWTIPSVASLFTGLYPSAHQVMSAANRIPEDAPLLAEHFRSYGYCTGAFVANQIVTGTNGYAQGFGTFFPPAPPWWVYHQRTAFERLATRVRRPASAARGWRLNQEFLRWLRATPHEPHFAYIHHFDPHSPYLPQVSDLNAVAPDAPQGPSDPPLFRDYEHELAGTDCRDWECLSNPPTLPAPDLAGMVARYDGEIHMTDRRVGTMLDELRELGILDRCHILFITDHGEEFWDHRGWFHGHSVYEEMIASPMAYRPPGGIRGGRVIARPVAMLDLLRTLCTLLHFETPLGHQGREIPELLGQPAPPDSVQPVLSEFPPYLYALRLGHWKLIRRGSASAPEWHLFDLTSDPLEHNDVARTLPDTAATLRGYMEGTVAELAKAPLANVREIEDPELLERLKSLGYIR